MPYDSEPDRRRAAARKAEAKDEAQEGTLRIGGLKSGQLQPAKSDARPKPAPVVDLGAGDEPARKPPVETPDL